MNELAHLRGFTDDEQREIGMLVAQLKARSRRNMLRSSFYDGKNAVRDIGLTIPDSYLNIGLALGWAAKGVDGLARRCNLNGFVDKGGADLAALGLDELVESNYLFSELSQARTDSLIHGVSYLIGSRGDVDRDEPKALVTAKSALDGTGEWDVRARRLRSFFSVSERQGRDIVAFTLYIRGLTVSARLDGTRWEIERATPTFDVPVEPLVYKPRQSRRMGKSRITRPVMSAQMAALRALLRVEAHMDIYAIPRLVVLGAREGMFKNADGSQKAAWQVVFGRVLGLPDTTDSSVENQRADVQQFAAESPKPHLDQLSMLAKLVARETDLPDTDFALENLANPPSEGSYVSSRENLLAEAEGAMDDWAMPIRRTVQRGLATLNDYDTVPNEFLSIDTKWRSPMHLSRSAEADAGAKQVGAVPWLAETRIGLELLGLTTQQIDQALNERQAGFGRSLVSALVNRGRNGDRLAIETVVRNDNHGG
ncbi:phage portal protein [Microbacterium sp. YY-01]|uniref:phage portal protein n=1 Tax=Microbacterium sp. YY-01 TaxID=3421634 RepID=UPI003D17032D